MNQHLVLRVVVKLLLPVILLFALYVQFHGDFGPGGGFQAGVIFGAAFILYTMLFGLRAGTQVLPPWVIRTGIAGGVLIFGGTGVASLLLGGNYLDYDVLAHDPLHGQHYGIILVELGVGVTVASTMVGIFFAFAGRR